MEHATKSSQYCSGFVRQQEFNLPQLVIYIRAVDLRSQFFSIAGFIREFFIPRNVERGDESLHFDSDIQWDWNDVVVNNQERKESDERSASCCRFKTNPVPFVRVPDIPDSFDKKRKSRKRKQQNQVKHQKAVHRQFRARSFLPFSLPILYHFRFYASVNRKAINPLCIPQNRSTKNELIWRQWKDFFVFSAHAVVENRPAGKAVKLGIWR